jgi:3-hydroxymyristoyl/3-hydroxydecanoyl-(acyl carrier protein) dehydratase
MKESIIDLSIPETHPCYVDHFPGDPVLPGALLLQWIFAHIQSAYPDICINEVKHAKFLQAVRPGDQCKLKIVLNPQNATISVDCLLNAATACHCKLQTSKKHE